MCGILGWNLFLKHFNVTKKLWQTGYPRASYKNGSKYDLRVSNSRRKNGTVDINNTWK